MDETDRVPAFIELGRSPLNKHTNIKLQIVISTKNKINTEFMEDSFRKMGRPVSVEMISELKLVLPCHLTLVKINSGAFHGSPVVRTLRLHCRGHRFDPWLGN